MADKAFFEKMTKLLNEGRFIDARDALTEYLGLKRDGVAPRSGGNGPRPPIDPKDPGG